MNRCLAIARSHAIAGNVVNSLALIKHALDRCKAAEPALSVDDNDDDEFTPRNIQVSKQDVAFLHDTLSGELQRHRALAEIFNNSAKSQTAVASPKKPLSSQLLDYPSGGAVDLDNIVAYPPRLEPFPVKPLFLDVAWNYIEYPDKQGPQLASAAAAANKGAGAGAGAGKPQEKAAAAAAEPEAAKPQKRGWFGFGR